MPDFLDSQHSIATKDDADAYLARLAGYAGAMDQELECARHDGGLGVTAPDFALDKALTQLSAQRDTPAAQSPLVQSLVRRAREAKLAGDWSTPATAIYESQVRPALDRQIAWVHEARPKATHDAGVWRLPDGRSTTPSRCRAAPPPRCLPRRCTAPACSWWRSWARAPTPSCAARA